MKVPHETFDSVTILDGSSSRGSGGLALLRMGLGQSADAAVLREVQVHAAIVPGAREEEEGSRGAKDKKEVENAKEDEALSDPQVVATV